MGSEEGRDFHPSLLKDSGLASCPETFIHPHKETDEIAEADKI